MENRIFDSLAEGQFALLVLIFLINFYCLGVVFATASMAIKGKLFIYKPFWRVFRILLLWPYIVCTDEVDRIL